MISLTQRYKNFFLTTSLTSLIFGVYSFIFSIPTYAQVHSPVCEIFPFLKGIKLFGGVCIISEENVGLGISELVRGVLNILRFASSFIFVFIIAIAIFVIIKASVKYILSEGNPQKVQEAQKSIRSVFFGLIALILSIVGLVVLLVVFQSSGALQVQSTPGENIFEFFVESFRSLN